MKKIWKSRSSKNWNFSAILGESDIKWIRTDPQLSGLGAPMLWFARFKLEVPVQCPNLEAIIRWPSKLDYKIVQKLKESEPLIDHDHLGTSIKNWQGQVLKVNLWQLANLASIRNGIVFLCETLELPLYCRQRAQSSQEDTVMDLSPEQNPELELPQSRWWSLSVRRRSHKRSFGRIRSPMPLGPGRSHWSRSPKENLGSLRRIQYPWELELDDLIFVLLWS